MAMALRASHACSGVSLFWSCRELARYVCSPSVSWDFRAYAVLHLGGHSETLGKILRPQHISYSLPPANAQKILAAVLVEEIFATLVHELSVVGGQVNNAGPNQALLRCHWAASNLCSVNYLPYLPFFAKLQRLLKPSLWTRGRDVSYGIFPNETISRSDT